MAYENYYFVSWSNGTPVTGDRLAQMSINTEQVKEVADNAAKGIIAYNLISANAVPNTTGWTDFAAHEIIYLRNEQIYDINNTEDNTVSVNQGRWYRISCTIPAIVIKGPGSEDCRFEISLYRGNNLADANALQWQTWSVTPHTYSYINVATAAANISNEALKTTNTYSTFIGSGVYSYLSATQYFTLSSQSFFLSIKRIAGASTANAPAWYIAANSVSPIVMYAEDLGVIT